MDSDEGRSRPVTNDNISVSVRVEFDRVNVVERGRGRSSRPTSDSKRLGRCSTFVFKGYVNAGCAGVLTSSVVPALGWSMR